MKRGILTAAALVYALALAGGWPATAHAQGVTTSAITGRVANTRGEPVQGAQVTATNTSTGASQRVVTRSDGRYSLQGLQPGGPYRVQVQGLGYATRADDGISLALGQTETLDFTLTQEAIAVEGISVVAEQGGVISRERTGTGAVVSQAAIERTPTITRNFTDFTRLVPQVSTSGSATNASGRSARFNSIQIDGAVNNDLFGLNSGGTPGSGAGAKPISLEAIQEFQVVIAPFDVRQGGFTGAGINAVTKAGTNRFSGSFTYFNKNESLVGRYQAPGGDRSSKFGEFSQNEFGFSIGGPVLRDRLHFFAAGEFSRRSAPMDIVATANSNITIGEVQQVADILKNQYGYNPGALGGLNLETDANNFFGRLDFQVNDAHRLTLRHNYVDALDDDLDRRTNLYRLGGSLFERDNATHSTVAQLNSILGGRFFNEFRVGYSTIRDKRLPQDRTPSVRIDVLGGSIFAGSEQFSGRNELDQDVLEVTNDLTFALGRHNLTLGTHNEFFTFSNLFVRNAFGYYEFRSPADLQAGKASRYEYSYLLPGGAERAEFDVRQYSIYVQDQIDVTDNLSVTAGLRYDVTTFPEAPGRNPEFEQAFPQLGRHTGQIPSGNGLLNPRIGFNWDVAGDGATQVRGGVGLFSGRTPYVWISNAYGNTGLDYVRFTCDGRNGNNPPPFSADPAKQSTTCFDANGQPTSNLAANEINLADPDFKLPQVLRTTLAVDRRLPLGFVGTLEGMYSKSRNDVLYRELNLKAPSGTVEGRPRYDGRLTRTFANVTDITNTDEGYSYNLTAQLQRSFSEDWAVSAAYTFTRARDVTSTTSSQAFSNWRFNPIGNDPNDPELRPSNFEVPHRVLLTGAYTAKLVRGAPTEVSLIYIGESGRPYSYTYSGDVNNDGSNGNDLLYVPRNASEIRFEPVSKNNPISPEESWANFNEFIESVACLREARGTVVKRNACREPWTNRVDLRLAQTIPSLRGQGVQLTFNVVNFLNLLNDEWGRSEFVSNQNDAVLRTASTTPDANGRVLFRSFKDGKEQFQVSDLASRYQVQLGLRYTF